MAQHKPPSRVRYEKTHPVIAFRVERGVYDALAEYRKETGETYAAILTKGMEANRRERDAYRRGSERMMDIAPRLVPPQLFLKKLPVKLGDCTQCGSAVIWNAQDVADHCRTWNKLNNVCPECANRPRCRHQRKPVV